MVCSGVKHIIVLSAHAVTRASTDDTVGSRSETQFNTEE